MADPNQRVIQAINACHVTEDELNTFLEEVLDGEHIASSDTMSNIIIGIMELNKVRIAKVEWEYRNTITNPHME
jgi:hypothetical protein